MKSLKAALILMLTGAVSLSACDFFETQNRRYHDEPQIGFSQPEQQLETVDEGAGTVTTEIQLIGPQRSSALSIAFAVDDSSSAEEGVHYDLGSTSTSIAANSSTVEVPIEVLDNDIDDRDTDYMLYVSLTDNELKVAENLRTYRLLIRGTDEDE